jgi:hypothetical protein
MGRIYESEVFGRAPVMDGTTTQSGVVRRRRAQTRVPP